MGAPEGPTSLGARSWLSVLKRTAKEFSEDNLTDWSAALTYYGILSIFPALIVVVSIVGLVGPSATQPLIDNVSTFAPGPARDVLTNAITGLASAQSAAGLLFVIGLAAALWAASAYVAAFMRASNAIYDIEEGRPIWKTIPLRIVVTVVVLVLLAASSIMVVLTGPLADKVGQLLGIGGGAVTAWDIVKWPVLLLFVSLIFAILYWAAPNVRHPGFRWVTPGGIFAVLVWIVASAAFAVYLANFGSYNKTYGTLGGVVAFLVWLWISNVAILFGAELNAELQRQRAIEAGENAETEPYVEPRDTRKMTDETAAQGRSR
jgi:membrane protein